MEELDNSIRLKVTGKCNRNCSFCHQEGNMHLINDLYYSDELANLVNRLNFESKFNVIAITGGEPLLFDGLLDLMSNLYNKTNLKSFSLTTNGTVSQKISYWKCLIRYGLKKVNVSIYDILNSEYLYPTSTYSIFEMQVNNLKMLNELKIIPTINVVVFKDKKKLIDILNVLFNLDLKFKIALLPDLTNDKTFNNSVNVIRETLTFFGFNKNNVRFRKGTSNIVSEYKTNNNKILQVKTTKLNGNPKHLHSICDNCDIKYRCQEGFYGLRVENVNQELMIRLCLYKSNSEVLLKADDFFKSIVYQEIKNNCIH